MDAPIAKASPRPHGLRHGLSRLLAYPVSGCAARGSPIRGACGRLPERLAHAGSRRDGPRDAAVPARAFAARSGRRARERHRRSDEVRSRPGRVDPAVGRRGRSRHPAVHRRGGDPIARRRRDLLHAPARDSGIARGARALPHQGVRARLRRGRILRHRVGDAVDPDRAGDDLGSWAGDRGADAMGPRARALFLVSPSNPTGWTATLDELRIVLSLARRHGLWIIADETYGRFWYGAGERAPSFLDVMEAEDRVLFVNTFSKNWAMTGWRIGWIRAHPALGQVIENLVQYSTSGVATFMQRAAVAALDLGEGFLAHQIARARLGRDILSRALAATGRCRFALPQGAFYLLFRVDGETDTRKLALRLIDEAGVGLAPGTALGRGGSDFLRACFARKSEEMEIAAQRLAEALR